MGELGRQSGIVESHRCPHCSTFNYARGTVVARCIGCEKSFDVSYWPESPHQRYTPPLSSPTTLTSLNCLDAYSLDTTVARTQSLSYTRGRIPQRNLQPTSCSRPSSASSARSMIDERMRWASQERSRSIGRKSPQTISPFTERSRYYGGYHESSYMSREPETLVMIRPVRGIPSGSVAVMKAPVATRVGDDVSYSTTPEKSPSNLQDALQASISELEILKEGEVEHHLVHVSTTLNRFIEAQKHNVLSRLERSQGQETQTEWTIDDDEQVAQETNASQARLQRDWKLLLSFNLQIDRTLAQEKDPNVHLESIQERTENLAQLYRDILGHVIQSNLLATPVPSSELDQSHASTKSGTMTSSTQAVFDDRPSTKYQCSTCSQSFTRSTTLKNHQRSHTGEKPFSCRLEGCSRSFAQKNDRDRHQRRHDGQKPFICGGTLSKGTPWGCGAAFARKDGLIEHHHKTAKGKQCLIKRDGTIEVSEIAV